jgi:hypothetical protein
MARRDFIPGGEAEFLAFAGIFCEAAEAYSSDLSIPKEVTGALKAELAAYTAAHTVCENPNAGKLDRETRNEKREILTASIRKIKNAYIDADPLGAVTDKTRLAFGLEPKDHTRTDIPVPTEVVPFELAGAQYLQIAVTHPPKPAGYLGAVAFFTTGTNAPADHEALARSKLLTKPHEIMIFDEKELGKTLYISLRWENEKGELGPWSPVQSKVIA